VNKVTIDSNRRSKSTIWGTY